MDQNVDQENLEINDVAMIAEEINAEEINAEEELTFIEKFPSTEDLEFPTDLEAEMESEGISDELLWQARTGLNHDTLCGAIETIIFMGDRPVSIQKIKALKNEKIVLF